MDCGDDDNIFPIHRDTHTAMTGEKKKIEAEFNINNNQKEQTNKRYKLSKTGSPKEGKKPIFPT